MLKGIPAILSPELLKVLCEMGHGDTIVIADGNFPAQSVGRNGIVLRADGHSVSDLLAAILQVFPLDTYVEHPAYLMEVVPGDPVKTPVWETYYRLIGEVDKRGSGAVGYLERFAFYEEASKAYAVIATGDRAQYANIILQKGVIKES